MKIEYIKPSTTNLATKIPDIIMERRTFLKTLLLDRLPENPPPELIRVNEGLYIPKQTNPYSGIRDWENRQYVLDMRKKGKPSFNGYNNYLPLVIDQEQESPSDNELQRTLQERYESIEVDVHSLIIDPDLGEQLGAKDWFEAFCPSFFEYLNAWDTIAHRRYGEENRPRPFHNLIEGLSISHGNRFETNTLYVDEHADHPRQIDVLLGDLNTLTYFGPPNEFSHSVEGINNPGLLTLYRDRNLNYFSIVRELFSDYIMKKYVNAHKGPGQLYFEEDANRLNSDMANANWYKQSLTDGEYDQDISIINGILDKLVSLGIQRDLHAGYQAHIESPSTLFAHILDTDPTIGVDPADFYKIMDDIIHGHMGESVDPNSPLGKFNRSINRLKGESLITLPPIIPYGEYLQSAVAITGDPIDIGNGPERFAIFPTFKIDLDEQGRERITYFDEGAGSVIVSFVRIKVPDSTDYYDFPLPIRPIDIPGDNTAVLAMPAIFTDPDAGVVIDLSKPNVEVHIYNYLPNSEGTDWSLHKHKMSFSNSSN